jgi:NAD(P)-dependent dehydrogenase (short-subunit alcohol dehydrogenase family)
MEPQPAKQRAQALRFARRRSRLLPAVSGTRDRKRTAAEAALNVYTWSIAQELAPSRIQVNTVTPDPVITPGGDEIREVFIDAMGMTAEQFFATVPLGRGGEAHEVAEVVALLVSDRGQWITGHDYFVDGGQAAF